MKRRKKKEHSTLIFTLECRKTKRRKRRRYMHGYRAGQRNLPFSMLPKGNADVCRGWGAGQVWLMKKTDPALHGL